MSETKGPTMVQICAEWPALRSAIDAAMQQLADVERKVSKGKGEWNTPGYVADESWSRIMGEYSALERVVKTYLSGIKGVEEFTQEAGDE